MAKKKIDYKKNLKTYWNFIKQQKFMFTITVVTIILANILNLGDKLIFKYLIDNATEFSSNLISLEFFMSTILTLGVVYLGIVITRSILSYISLKSLALLDSNLMLKIKEKYFNHIIKLDSSFHNSNKTGSLISRLTRGSGAFENFTDTVFFNLTPFIIQLFILIPLFIQFGKWQALILVGTCGTYLFYSLSLNKRMLKDRNAENKASDKEKGFIADIFTNIESVKYFGKEKTIGTKFQKKINETRKKQLKSWNWWNWISAGNTIILGIGTTLLFAISLIQFTKGILTLGEVSFIYTTYIALLGPLNWFTHGVRQISRSLTDMQDLFEYGEVSKDIQDSPNAKNLKIKSGKVELKNINFQYPKGQKIFENFNLKIPAGKTVALVGHSGCGKSTIVKLLYRLYDPKEGEILIDNKNIKSFKQESLRSEMAIVSQEPILFDDTIYNNIKFARPSATKEEIEKAIHFAQLDKVIKQLPKKEKTIVGERGVKLSGGQKQRVSIARAILANKKILVLDEATSALDSETEFEIQRDLEKLMKNRTSIVIAHRLSTIMNADIIVVMEEGKIVEIGSHRELISNDNGEYQKLWNFQKGGFIQD